MKNIKIIIGTENKIQEDGALVNYICDNYINSIIIASNADECECSYKLYDDKKILNFQTSVLTSGCLNNIPIFFPGYLKINPALLWHDLTYLNKFGYDLSNFYIDENCFILTPIDNLMFHFLVSKKANYKIDIRKDYKEWAYTFKDFYDNDPYIVCKNIYNDFYKPLLKEYNITTFNNIDFEQLKDFCRWDRKYGKEVFYNVKLFCLSIKYLQEKFILTNFNKIYSEFDNLIFEIHKALFDKNTLYNDIKIFINDKKNINVEICYLSDSYNENIWNICQQHYKKYFDNDNIKYGLFIPYNKNFLGNPKILGMIKDCKEKSTISVIKNIKSNVNNNNDFNIIFQHNHNSGLPYVINLYKYKKKWTLALSPTIYDYPFQFNNGTNIDSIDITETYNGHMEYIINDFNDRYCLLLLDPDFLIDKTTLKNYYINFLQIKKFIVTSVDQAKDIKNIDPNLIVIGKLNNVINKSLEYFDEIIIDNNSNINIINDIDKNIKININVNLDKDCFDDICAKWHNYCNNYYFEYGQKYCYMEKIGNKIDKINSVIAIYKGDDINEIC